MSDALPVLDSVEQRVLGSLLEKQRTVPGSYPLTLNSLRLACNQLNSREPVVDYDEATVQAACRALKERGLLRVVWAEKGSRTLKYHQLLDAGLGLQPDERAVLTVLLLRGAQAPGELKTRTERLHPFADRSEVEAVLARLAALPQPLVRELELRAGQQDRRWIHLLGPVETATAAAATGVDREAVLAEGAAARDAKVVAGYDAMAAAYAAEYGEELTHKPFDVWLLERIAGLAQGPIADVGCGPGHVTAFLADTGAAVAGFDASPAMIAEASAAFGDLDFGVARFHQVLRPRTAPAWGAIVCWYAFVHLAPSELSGTMARLAATLAPGGVFALALYVGEEVRHATTLLGTDVDLDFVLHDRDQVLAACTSAGLVGLEWYERSPYPEEVATRRLYVLGRTPD